jgi:hypothetical protein
MRREIFMNEMLLASRAADAKPVFRGMANAVRALARRQIPVSSRRNTWLASP